MGEGEGWSDHRHLSQFETICERCGFYDTGPEFVPVLLRQPDHATTNDQPDRAQLYHQLLATIDDTA